MKKTRTRFLSILLTLCMVLTLLPTVALADGYAVTGSGTEASPWRVYTYRQLKEKMETAGGGYIELGAQLELELNSYVEANNSIVIPANANVHLNLAGNKVYMYTSDGKIDQWIEVSAGASLVVDNKLVDARVDYGGIDTFNYSVNGNYLPIFQLASSATLTLNGGYFSAPGGGPSGGTGKVIINGGTIKDAAANAGYAYDVTDLTVNGGTFEGKLNVTGKLTVNGGIFNRNVAANEVMIKGGYFAEGLQAIRGEIHGGTFRSENEYVYYCFRHIQKDEFTSDAEPLAIYGGDFIKGSFACVTIYGGLFAGQRQSSFYHSTINGGIFTKAFPLGDIKINQGVFCNKVYCLYDSRHNSQEDIQKEMLDSLGGSVLILDGKVTAKDKIGFYKTGNYGGSALYFDYDGCLIVKNNASDPTDLTAQFTVQTVARGTAGTVLSYDDLPAVVNIPAGVATTVEISHVELPKALTDKGYKLEEYIKIDGKTYDRFALTGFSAGDTTVTVGKKFIASDGVTVIDSAEKTYTVRAQDDTPKISGITVTPSGELLAATSTTLTANVTSTPADGVTYHYQWDTVDPQDGTATVLKAVSTEITFTGTLTAGSHTVRLTAWAKKGGVKTGSDVIVTKDVNVYAEAPVEITVQPTAQIANGSGNATFTATGKNAKNATWYKVANGVKTELFATVSFTAGVATLTTTTSVIGDDDTVVCEFSNSRGSVWTNYVRLDRPSTLSGGTTVTVTAGQTAWLKTTSTSGNQYESATGWYKRVGTTDTKLTAADTRFHLMGANLAIEKVTVEDAGTYVRKLKTNADSNALETVFTLTVNAAGETPAVTPIYYFDVTYPTPVWNADVSTTTNVTVPTDCHYTVESIIWKDASSWTSDATALMKFKGEAPFSVQIVLKADAGYRFFGVNGSNNVYGSVNGINFDGTDTREGYYSSEAAQNTCKITISYSNSVGAFKQLTSPTDTVTITTDLLSFTAKQAAAGQNIAATVDCPDNHGTPSHTIQSYTAVSTLPAGLSLDSITGVISGTPTIAGTYNILTQATSTYGVIGEKIIPLTVAEANVTTCDPHNYGAWVTTKAATETKNGSKYHVCTICGHSEIEVIPATGTISVTTADLPDGKVFTAYAGATLASTPVGTGWKSSSLPSGLTLNETTGAISGTPTEAGTFAVTVATYKDDLVAEKKLTLVVEPAPLATANATVAAPVTGASVSSAAGGTGFYAANTTWSPDATAFAASTAYTVQIELETTGNYVFDNNTVFQINGNTVTPSAKTSETATISYTFPATAGNGGGSSGGGVSSYTLTFNVNGGSAISAVSKTSGTTVDLTAYKSTKTGYTFDGWYSDAKLTTKVTSVKLTANTTVYAKWTAASDLPFTDVPADAYYKDAVKWAVDEGITEGTSATTFNPNGICTRAQAVTFLWRTSGSPAPTVTSCPFTDVSKDAYYYKAVLWAVEKGITKGTSDTTFSPAKDCSRAQIVTFQYRTAGSPATDTVNPFTDVASEAYYANAVLWAVKEGITQGTTTTTFSPNDDCTRAQIVTFLFRQLGK